MQPYVIFDMDGVLVDSEPFHKQVLARALRELGVELTSEYHNSLIGMAGMPIYKKMISDFELSIHPQELMSFHKGLFYKELENCEVPAVDDVLNLLETLKRENFSLSLGSSSPKKLIDIFVNRLEIGDYFDHLVSSEDVERGKPSPDIFLEIARKYDKNAEEFVVIEDSRNGVIAAKTARMKCIGFKNPNSGNQDLSRADLIIESFSDLSGQRIKDL
ncbi:HAD-IA family hydrolase [Leptobacterium flavescens]|uniref:HAD-IA family hydrolase n=1 Tax=Leptobacterium flavescens TaxID=472055 RepID=A0A6P0UYJ9_9FLAO|nr:HAD-IA family hydrolase [Leptobacterium flavescens]NER15526.1 HAD-IA family hydrolase [Leptobacterium flavescens]